MDEKERVKELKLLKSTYEMYENSKKDTETKLKQKLKSDGSPVYSKEEIASRLKLIQEMQDDIVEQYQGYGGKPDDLVKSKKTTKKVTASRTVKDVVAEDENKIMALPEKPVEKRQEEKIEPVQDTMPMYNPGKVAFDVIPLPSGGECYRNKMSKVQVAYLTAYDENILVSPNLYRDNTVLDYILKGKLINCPIEPEELVQGDRDAIILWLRATGYGNEFPITATDNESGKDFEAVVDLSKINFKKFDLKGDENGWFDFETPLTHDKVKFKFLTAGDTKYLNDLEENEKMDSAISKLTEMTEDIGTFIEKDKILNRDEKKKIFEAQNALNEWRDKLVDNDQRDIPYTNIITNKMELMTMEINGNRDRKYIHNYIMSMNVRDAAEYRKYVSTNEPGLDFNIEIEKPESLGGGTINVFLQLDQYLFLNIA